MVDIVQLPLQLDFEVYRADDYRFGVQIEAAGNAVDLSGADIKAQVRKNSSPTAPLVFALEVYDRNDAAGTFWLWVHSADTKALKGSAYPWDCQIKMGAGGDVKTYLAGTVTIIPDTSR